MTLRDRLHRARTRAGLTGAELGRLAGLSHAIVSMIESNERKDPSGSTIVALASTLGVSPNWLLTGEGSLPSKASLRVAVDAARAKRGAKPPEGDAA